MVKTDRSLFVGVPLPCAWIHPEAFEITVTAESDSVPGCPECGKLLSWGSCWFCGIDFLIFGTGGDDIIADAAVTTSGDLMCFPCAAHFESVEEEDQDWGLYDES